MDKAAAFHMGASSSPATPLMIPLLGHGKQWEMAQVLGPLPSVRESKEAAGSGLAEPWFWQPFGKCTNMKIASPSFCKPAFQINKQIKNKYFFKMSSQDCENIFKTGAIIHIISE